MTPTELGNIIFWVFFYFIVGCFALTYCIALYQYLRWFFRRSSKMPKCGNCDLKYKPTGDMAPRVLNCGHSCCGGCIRKLVGQMTWAGIIYCPFCKRSSLLNNTAPLSSFPINHLLLKYKSTLSSLVLYCEACKRDYSSQESSRTPRVHLSCGHTSCETCVEMDNLRYGQVACQTCGAMAMDLPGTSEGYY